MKKPLVFALMLVAVPALAKKEKTPKTPPPACGLRSIPLALGNVWTYKSGQHTVLVRVAEVGPEKEDGTVEIKMEEKFQDRTLQTTWTCNEKKGVVIAPDSFFFAAEPGGAVASTVTITKRDNVTLQADKDLEPGGGWVEKVHGELARTDTGGQGATHKPGKWEIERHVSVGNSEQLELAIGKANALRITFELRGRGLVENEKFEIPIKRPGALYVMKGLGVVKLEDAFDRDWELVSTTVPFGKK